MSTYFQNKTRTYFDGMLLCAFVLSLFVAPEVTYGISLDSYLEQVKSKNKNYQSADLSYSAAEKGKSQANLLTSPQFFISGQSVQDKSPTIQGEFNGTERRNQNIQTGIQTNTSVGLQGRLYLSQDAQKTLGSSFIQPGQESIDLQSYNLELKLPLWQNGFGRDVRLQQKAITSQVEGERLQSEFEKISTLQKAELTYFKLSKVQQEKEVLSRLVDQGSKLVAWAKEKVSSRLLENSNLTESVAALTSRNLELEGKIIEYEDALRDFNSLREFPIDSQVDLDNLKSHLEKTDINLKASSSSRLDVKAQEKFIEAEKDNHRRSQESLKPKLDVSTKFSSFTKQSDLNDTRRCTNTTACSQVVIGLIFEMPLDFSNTESATSSLQQKIEARELALQRSRIESEHGLLRLQKSLSLLTSQLKAAESLIQAQKARLAAERTRQRLGRGSTFDVIRAEQDFAQSELALIQIQYAKIQTAISMKLYISSEEK